MNRGYESLGILVMSAFTGTLEYCAY